MTASIAQAPAAAAEAKGGFWERSLAYVIDGVLLAVTAALVNIVTGALAPDSALPSAINVLVSIAYFVYFWSGSGGSRTPGMRVFGLRVVRTDGRPLSLVGALLRWVGLLVSFLVLGIGVLWIAFDANKQGWHDKIASTFVLMTPREPYPVRVAFDVPPGHGRFWAIPLVGLVARVILLVPHLLVLYVVGLVVYLAQLVLWIPVIFNGRYPAWGYRLIGGYVRWYTRVIAYLFGLTDRYPTPFEPGA